MFPVLAPIDIRVFHDVAVQGCGLGSTSLINANVVMQADQKISNPHRWPKAILQDFKENGTSG